jgi:hypothetical protein
MSRGEEASVADRWAKEICRFRYGRTADPKNRGPRYSVWALKSEGEPYL